MSNLQNAVELSTAMHLVRNPSVTMAGIESVVLVTSPGHVHPGKVVTCGSFVDVLPGECAKRAGKAPWYSEPERQGSIQRYARKIPGSIASVAVW
jgi:hypothetical protein